LDGEWSRKKKGTKEKMEKKEEEEEEVSSLTNINIRFNSKSLMVDILIDRRKRKKQTTDERAREREM
jgi:hypothetical protein